MKFKVGDKVRFKYSPFEGIEDNLVHTVINFASHNNTYNILPGIEPVHELHAGDYWFDADVLELDQKATNMSTINQFLGVKDES